MNSANVEIPLLQNLFYAVVFALSITIFHVYKQIREVKKLHGGSLSAEDFSMRQTLNLQLPLTKDQIVARLKNTFPSKNWEIAEEADEIKLKTIYSWKSFGEKVSIKVKNMNSNISEVRVESRPKYMFTILDYAKNQENIIYLRDLLAA